MAKKNKDETSMSLTNTIMMIMMVLLGILLGLVIAYFPMNDFMCSHHMVEVPVNESVTTPLVATGAPAAPTAPTAPTAPAVTGGRKLFRNRFR